MKSIQIPTLLLVVFITLSGTTALQAQAKFKPPTLLISLGDSKDSVLTISAEKVASIINEPLRITDAKQHPYNISSYQCMYKRRAVTEDEDTGKVSPITSIVAERFTSTPLPEIWRRTIIQQLKPGEEILFFDIIVKDDKGRLMYAPSLKITVEP